LKYREYDCAPAALHLRHSVNAYKISRIRNKSPYPMISYVSLPLPPVFRVHYEGHVFRV